LTPALPTSSLSAMPSVICPHCGQPVDVAPEPISTLAYATPYPERQSEKKWMMIVRLCLAFVAVVVAVLALFLVRHLTFQQPLPINVAAQMQQTQQIMQAAQKQQAAAQQQVRRSMELGKRMSCAGNMLQINMALMQYSQKNDGSYPAQLDDLVRDHFITPDVLSCPAKNQFSPLLNASVLPATQQSNEDDHYIYVPDVTSSSTADTVVLYESLSNHDDQGMNVLYHNGHVEFLEKSTAERVLAELKAGYNPPRYGHY